MPRVMQMSFSICYFNIFIRKLPKLRRVWGSAIHLDENGNSSVNGPSSIEYFSRSSIDTSFSVCTAVASNTTLFHQSALRKRICVPRNNGIPDLIPSFECFEPTLNSHTPPTSICQSPESVLEARSNQIIPTATSKVQKFFSNYGSDCVRIRIEGRIIAIPQSHEAYPRSKIT